MLRKGQELQRMSQEAMFRQQEELFKREEQQQRKEAEEIVAKMAEQQRQLDEEQRKLDAERKMMAEERRKEELERKKELQEQLRQQANKEAKALQASLKELLEEEQRLVTFAVQQVQPLLTAVPAFSDNETLSCAAEFDQCLRLAREAHKACTDFLLGKHGKISGVTDETRLEAGKLLKAMGEVKKEVEQCATKVKLKKDFAQERRDREARLAAVRKAREKEEQTFKRCDADGDGMLSGAEILVYAREEYCLELTEAKLKLILASDAVPRGKAGTPWESFPKLKLQIGYVLNEASAKRVKEQSVIVQGNVKETNGAIDIVEAEVQKVEKTAHPLVFSMSGRGPPPAVLEERADEVAIGVDAAQDYAAAATEKAEGLAEGIGRTPEPMIANLISIESKKLTGRIERLRARLHKVASTAEAVKLKLALARKKQALMRELADVYASTS